MALKNKTPLTVNYEKLPISADTLKGMNMNIYDQQFIKRVMDRQDEIAQEANEVLYNKYANFVTKQFQCIADEIKLELKLVNIEVKEMKADIKLLQIIAEKNQMDIKAINGDMQQMKKDISEHQFIIDHIQKHLGL